MCGRRRALAGVWATAAAAGASGVAETADPDTALPEAPSHLLAQPADPAVDAVIAKAEEARQGLHVPFFMYDGVVGDVNFTASFDILATCAKNYTYGNALSRGMQEFYFITALLVDQWRVGHSADAQIIVIPVATFDLVERDGLHGSLELCPAYDAQTLLKTIERTDLHQRRRADHLILAGHDFAYRFFEATGWMLATQQTVSARPGHRMLISPYSTLPSWPGDFPPLDVPRPINFFFGGGTAMFNNPERFGQGGRRLGYYLRNHILADRATMPPRTLLISSSASTATCDSRSHRTCEELLLPCGSVLNSSTRMMQGTCHGQYHPDILKQVEFCIAARGDNPSSPRLYEAAQYGAIPIFLSDMVLQVSTPFQCFVPYALFTLSLRERLCLAGCGRALENLTAGASSQGLRRKRLLLAHFRRDLLWAAPNSRVAQNLLLEAAHRFYSGSPAGKVCPFEDHLQLCVADVQAKTWQEWSRRQAACGTL